jgi:hypothetical protein
MAWFKDVTDRQSLLTNQVSVAMWVMVSAGKSKKDLVRAPVANPILNDTERSLVEFKQAGFLYALFPVIRPEREPVGEIVRQYMKLHDIFYVNVIMIADGMGNGLPMVMPP